MMITRIQLIYYYDVVMELLYNTSKTYSATTNG